MLAIAIASVSIAFTSAIIVPIGIMLFRVTVKWTRIEARLEGVAENLQKIVADKDRVHQEITTQITNDRAVTDKRLRWLEEHIWKTDARNHT